MELQKEKTDRNLTLSFFHCWIFKLFLSPFRLLWHNTTHWLVNNRNLFLPVLEGRKSKVKALVDLVSGEGLLSYGGTNCISEDPALVTWSPPTAHTYKSCWRFSFKMWIWGVHKHSVSSSVFLESQNHTIWVEDNGTLQLHSVTI